MNREDKLTGRVKPGRRQWLWGLAALLIASLLGALWYRAVAPPATFTYPGYLSGLRFSPNGKMVAATITRNNRPQGAVLFDTRTWKLLRTLPGAVDIAWFSADSRSVITTGFESGATPDTAASTAKLIADKAALKRAHPDWNEQQILMELISLKPHQVLQRWDAATGRPLYRVLLPDGRLVAVSHDWRLVVYDLGQDGMRVWDTTTGRLTRSLPTPASVVWPAFSPDNTLLATGDATGTMQGLWDVRSGKRLTGLDRKLSGVLGLRFSPSGHLLATATRSRLLLWDTRTWTSLKTFPAPHADWIGQLRFCKDGSRVIEDAFSESKASDGSEAPIHTMIIWNVQTGQVLCRARDYHLQGLAPQGRFAVALQEKVPSGQAVTLTLWDITTGRRLGQYVDAVSWDISPDARTFLTVTQHDEPRPSPTPANYEREETSVFSVHSLPPT